MTQAYTQLLETLSLTRRSWRMRRVVEGVLLVLTAVVAAFVIATLLDQWLALSVPLRVIVAAAVWACILGSLWVGLAAPLLMAHSDDYFAALLEHKLPHLGNRLINALQLGRETHHAAPRLVEAIVVDGVRATDELNPASAIGSPRLRRRGVALACAAFVAIVYGLVGGPGARASFMRILLPGASIAPFTWTHLTMRVTPGPRVLAGTPLDIQVSITGRPASAAVLHVSRDTGSQSLAMTADSRDANTFHYRFAAVAASFDLQAAAGDGETNSVSITVDPRPRVDRMAVTYQYPAYTSLAAKTVADFDGHLHGLQQTKATLYFRTNKPLQSLSIDLDGKTIAASPTKAMPATTDANDVPAGGGNASPPVEGELWQATLTLASPGTWRVHLTDRQGYAVDVPSAYTLALDQDNPPAIAFLRPARDMQAGPKTDASFALLAQDDYGLGAVTMLGIINDAKNAKTIKAWPNAGPPQHRVTLDLKQSIASLGLKGGDRMEYWATTVDRNDVTGPGRAQTRHYRLLVLTPEQAQALLDKQIAEYAKVIENLIRLQQLNRQASAAYKGAAELIDRETQIRSQTLHLAQVMERNSFPARSMIDELNLLAAKPMAEVVTLLEGYRDATTLDSGKPLVKKSLPTQDKIIAALKKMLLRLNRAEEVRNKLRRKEQDQPKQAKKAEQRIEKLHEELDKFLADLKQAQDIYAKMPKRPDDDEAKGESAEALKDIEEKLDDLKQWAKDSVAALAALPKNALTDSALPQSLNAIFEEVEKQERKPTREIATPAEEGIKALSQKVKEDLEMWMLHSGDNVKWAMEQPPEGKFDIPNPPLPDSLQDLIGDLVEDQKEFDEKADDNTSSWGGSMQAGWGIVDGPISSFAANGKTGNQMPNKNEISGRSGSGRRGRTTGQMVGAESRAMEGRDTPARVTNDAYQKGWAKASKQLNPHGATGGGKKTGGGQQGLQGGTPPDFVKAMKRMAQKQAIIREKVEKVASRLQAHGKPLAQVQRAIQLMKNSEQDYRDQRYQDGARQRKLALEALRAAGDQVDQAVSLSLQRAHQLPPELRKQITAGARQALPEGYEDIVGAYYKALSESGEK